MEIFALCSADFGRPFVAALNLARVSIEGALPNLANLIFSLVSSEIVAPEALHSAQRFFPHWLIASRCFEDMLLPLWTRLIASLALGS